MSVLLSNPQHEFGHLRPAVEAQRLFARQATHYVEYRGRLVKRSAIIAPAVKTGDED